MLSGMVLGAQSRPLDGPRVPMTPKMNPNGALGTVSTFASGSACCSSRPPASARGSAQDRATHRIAILRLRVRNRTHLTFHGARRRFCQSWQDRHTCASRSALGPPHPDPSVDLEVPGGREALHAAQAQQERVELLLAHVLALDRGHEPGLQHLLVPAGDATKSARNIRTQLSADLLYLRTCDE